VLTLGTGDMRKVLNILQSTSMAHDAVTEETVYSSTGHPMPADIATLLTLLMSASFRDALQGAAALKAAKGLALSDMLMEVSRQVAEVALPPKARVFLLMSLSDIEHRLAFGCSEKLQMAALVAAFVCMRSTMMR
jgi:replication factor C subunit 3/5